MEYEQLLRQRQHQLRILQIFPPHLDDSELSHKEWTYFALEIARIGVILIAPCCVLYHLEVIRLDSVLCNITVALCIMQLFISAVDVTTGVATTLDHISHFRIVILYYTLKAEQKGCNIGIR